MQIYTAAMNLAGVSQKSYEETMRTFALVAINDKWIKYCLLYNYKTDDTFRYA